MSGISWRYLTLAAVLVLFAAACGGSSGDSDEQPDTSISEKESASGDDIDMGHDESDGHPDTTEGSTSEDPSEPDAHEDSHSHGSDVTTGR